MQNKVQMYLIDLKEKLGVCKILNAELMKTVLDRDRTIDTLNVVVRKRDEYIIELQKEIKVLREVIEAL